MAPKAPGKGAKKAAKSKKEERRGTGGVYSIYLYKVMKQVHTDTGISSRAMSIIETALSTISSSAIAAEAARFGPIQQKIHHHQSGGPDRRQTVAGLVKLAPNTAVSEGTKAVTKYTTSINGSAWTHGGCPPSPKPTLF
ncbi:Histone H2B 7 [Holothuria leucospilota]|uniref:Histone H2B 7 n=1 Tax=Holothuria leucospilota TaxID=206669 RepID=A0A9Q1BA11_HOLLE|nr:Histone H2B 7 [Holothuria leucospilota]